jgi:hypothetical protein
MSIKHLISEIRQEIRWVAYGALFFWFPDILVHAFARNRFDGPQVWLVTAACPLALLVGYFVAAHFAARKISSLHPGLMILGMWCAGGIAMSAAWSFEGAGLANKSNLLFAGAVSLLTVVFPPLTAMLATYDGTLFALILGTLLMGIEAGTLSAQLVQPKLWKTAG